MRVSLQGYSAEGFDRGRPLVFEVVWILCQGLLFGTWLPGSVWRCWLLRLFGASLGDGVVIKPRVRVKFPWKLTVGSWVWIGEGAWIDNLADVVIGSNACVSQGAYLCTGNHDWSDPRFSLHAEGIEVKSCAWVGAYTVVTPGVQVGEGAVVAAGSVVSSDVPAWEVWAGNPAKFVRKRVVREG